MAVGWNLFPEVIDQQIVVVPEIDDPVPVDFLISMQADSVILGVAGSVEFAFQCGEDKTDVVVGRGIHQVSEFLF